ANLTIEGFDGQSTTDVTQMITWTPTDLNGKSASTDIVKIRKNDSLLLTASGTGAVLTIDADGDGLVDLTGAPDNNFAYQYATSGTFVAQAWIDGNLVGTLTVVVVDVNFNGPIACEAHFQREKDVTIIGGTSVDVTFACSDMGRLAVSVETPTANGARLL